MGTSGAQTSSRFLGRSCFTLPLATEAIKQQYLFLATQQLQQAQKKQSWRAFDNAKDTTGSPKVSTQRMPGVSSHRPVWVNPVCAANVSSAYPPVRDAF